MLFNRHTVSCVMAVGAFGLALAGKDGQGLTLIIGAFALEMVHAWLVARAQDR